jgi:iron complex transport system ATP-binding protein
LAKERFGVLSQGEKQRILICRARMAKPYLMILDEPCAGLDPGGRELLLKSISKLAENQRDMGLILVTQHVEEILPIFEHTLALQTGKVFKCGRTSKIICSDTISRLYGINAEVRSENNRYWMTCR